MNLTNLVKVALFAPKSLEYPKAWAGHLPFAAWLIEETVPKVFVELGTHTGNSYFAFCQAISESGIAAKCYAVDTWQGDDHAGKYNDNVFNKVKEHHSKHYLGFSHLLRMMFDEAADQFDDESIDLLHIDGLHTYDAVRHDFETWLPKLAPGAIVIFHDTNVRERNFGVWRLWEELQVLYPNNLEFKHSHGLGVLQLNNAPDNKKLSWLKANSVEKPLLLNYFAALGSRILESFELNEIKQLATDLSQSLAEREEHIENLQIRVADLLAEQNHILTSISWKITKPFRFIRRNLISKLYISLRRSVSYLARQIWVGLPFSIQYKMLLKKRLFSNLSFVFSWSEAYRCWESINSDEDTILFSNQAVLSMPQSTFDGYVPISAAPAPKNLPVRLIAFYLPQFHEIDQNNQWWGKGFTEWSNVMPAQSQFEGHYQPHIPDALGYYNLLDSTTQKRQVELAKLYGVAGFCFYTYWFGGELLLEKPIENYLNDNTLDHPFCLCWANENWSRRWDGLDSEILIAQKHSPHDDLAFIQYVAKYMRDERYIRINGKPLLLVYRPHLLPQAKQTAKRWRKWCLENGIGDIYLAYTQSFEVVNPSKYGFDAAIEFPPNNTFPLNITNSVKPLNGNFKGIVYDWRVFVERSRRYKTPAYKLFRSVCPSWDNTARRKNKGTVFLNSNPKSYQEWLGNAVTETCSRIENPNERLVFVNAWNEWAEGAHLEPDQRYGYAYLEATRNALLGEANLKKKRKIIVVTHDAHPHGAQYLALSIVREFSESFDFSVDLVCLGGGKLKQQYAQYANLHDLDGLDHRGSVANALAQQLVGKGHKFAIVNTTVSGFFLETLKLYGIECISLIHEMRGVLDQHNLYGQAKTIARLANKVVFAAQEVADDFQKIAPINEENCIIRPQGIYKKTKENYNQKNAHKVLRNELNLPLDALIVLGVGYADHRKGVDLFVAAGEILLKRILNVYFVWVGHWDGGMKTWVENKLADYPQMSSHFIFPGRRDDTELFYSGADVYALTSREDPFPSVLLEAMDAGLPVVGFEGGGGYTDLFTRGCGKLIAGFDVNEFAFALESILDNQNIASNMGQIGQMIIRENFSFQNYLFDLLSLLKYPLPRVSVVVPNYNYAQFIAQRIATIERQKFPIYELIILDDCSSDDSAQIIVNVILHSSLNIKFVRNNINSGSVFSQWHKGVELATGDLVWIAEADDLSEPNFLTEVLPAFDDPSVVLSYCESKQIDLASKVLCDNYLDYVKDIGAERWYKPYVYDGNEEIVDALSVKNTIPNVSAVVFRRDVISEVLNSELGKICEFKVAGDWYVYTKVLEHGKIAFTPKSENLHRRHSNSVTNASLNMSQLTEIVQMQNLITNKYLVSEARQKMANVYSQKLYGQFGLATKDLPRFDQVIYTGDDK